MNLVISIFRGPWWVLAAIGAGLIWLSTVAGGGEARQRALVLEALKRPAPAAVSIADLPDPDGPLVEASVVAQVLPDQTTNLIERRNGIERASALMYVLAPEGAETLEDARLFVMAEPADADAMPGWLIARTVGMGAMGPLVKIEGRITGYHSSGDHAEEVLEERGIDVARNAVFLEPYVQGRDAYLEAMARRLEGSPAGTAFLYGGLGALALAALKLALTARRGRGGAGAARPYGADGPDAAGTPADAPVAAAAMAPPKPLEEMTPRERVLWKAQQRAARGI